MATGGAGPYFIGVDVGTKSVRSGLFTAAGRLVSRSTHEIKIWTNSGFPEGSREQATTDIWNAVCSTVKVHKPSLLRSLITWCAEMMGAGEYMGVVTMGAGEYVGVAMMGAVEKFGSGASSR